MTVSPSQVAAALERVIEPEVGIDVVDLGLVYGVEVDDADVHVDLGVTMPTCPYSQQLAEDAEAAVLSIPEVERVDVVLCLDPPWSPDMLSDRARRRLAWGGAAVSASPCSPMGWGAGATTEELVAPR